MTDEGHIDAVLVTRGSRDISQVVRSLRRFRTTVIWDNSKFPNLKVYGRYVGASTLAGTHLVYMQDDDVVLEEGGFEELLGAWRPGSIALNFPAGNRRNYEGRHGKVALVGFGAICERSLIGPAFQKYSRTFPLDDLFLRECDRVFTALTPWVAVDAAKRDMPWAGTQESMEAEAQHGPDLEAIKDRICRLSD